MPNTATKKQKTAAADNYSTEVLPLDTLLPAIFTPSPQVPTKTMPRTSGATTTATITAPLTHPPKFAEANNKTLPSHTVKPSGTGIYNKFPAPRQNKTTTTSTTSTAGNKNSVVSKNTTTTASATTTTTTKKAPITTTTTTTSATPPVKPQRVPLPSKNTTQQVGTKAKFSMADFMSAPVDFSKAPPESEPTVPARKVPLNEISFHTVKQPADKKLEVEIADMDLENPVLPYSACFTVPLLMRQQTLDKLVELYRQRNPDRRQATIDAIKAEADLFSKTKCKNTYKNQSVNLFTRLKKDISTSNVTNQHNVAKHILPIPQQRQQVNNGHLRQSVMPSAVH